MILDKVAKIAQTNNWDVVSEASLSQLSFLKINMYNDLNNHKDSISSNPIVRAISGDTSASNVVPEGLLDFDFDKNINPTEMFQFVDADSSQQDAILCAKNGLSFVLQGPPGTGKSQTITNIIAECLADGKKVLFVSEKLAALDVVHRRLTSVGLSDFCLILHKFNANKREVLNQLGTTLSLSDKEASINDEAFSKLETLQIHKEELNEYAEQVFDTVMPLGKSIYQVNGELARLDSYDYVVFKIDNIGNVDAKQYRRYTYLLQQYTTTIGKMTDDYKNNPWYGAVVPCCFTRSAS